MKLTAAQANKVWNLLTSKYGAKEEDRYSFCEYFTKDNRFSHEYRFMGIFGFGGKIRLGYRGLYADYYPESSTPKLDAEMSSLNDALQAFWKEFACESNKV
jgi:hypothetical protein